MENTNVLDSFKELGYLIQEPTTDKTYFFIKQTEKGTRRIYVKLKKKIAKVDCYFNYNVSNLTDEEMALINDWLIVDLDLDGYDLN